MLWCLCIEQSRPSQRGSKPFHRSLFVVCACVYIVCCVNVCESVQPIHKHHSILLYLILDCIVHSIISPADVTITEASKASTLCETIGSNGSLVQRSSIGPSLSGSTRFLWRGTWHKNWHRFLLWWSLQDTEIHAMITIRGSK